MTAEPLPPAPRRPSPAAPARRPRGRERTLSKKAIADAALRIVDTDGLDALTMRHVSELLGTGAASLYAHVSGKEELLELLIDRVIGEVQLPGEPDPSRWQEQVKEFARSTRATFARHRDLARASFGRIPTGENALLTAEQMIGVMRAGGLTDRVVALAADLVSLYVMGIAYEDGLRSGENWAPDQVTEFVAQLHDYFASLPRDRFPNVVSLAGPLTEGDADARFEFGLDVLLQGLIALSRNEH